jgi:N-acetyl sugar amidotransferase
MKKNFSLFGLPEKVLFCTKCVMSNQRPRSVIEFKNINNLKLGLNINTNTAVCDACNYNETKKKIDWKKREGELIQLLKKFRKPTGYDCIVPGSGGKDSAYTAHVLKYKYGMNPLTVTWAPHIYTDIGWKNFDNWIKIGGFDNILFTPNGKVHKLLTKLAFKNLLHPFQPFIIGQKIIGPSIALKFDIPLIFYGENQAEYGNAEKENLNSKMDIKFFSRINNSEVFLGGEKLSNLIKNYNLRLNDFEPYLAPSLDLLNKKKIEQRYLGYYLKWDPQECYYYAVNNTGFRPNTERTEGSYSKYSSIDDKIDPFHYYLTFIKFGLGRASYDAAQEIRNEKITRDEGISLVKRFDNEFPMKYFKEFLDYVEITEEDFFSTLDKFRSPHLWRKTRDEWQLIQKIY